MKAIRIGLALAALASAVALTSTPARAESNLNGAVAAGGTATARVNLSVTIPKLLFLRVGTGSPYPGSTPSGLMAGNSAIDTLAFTVPAANVGNGTAVTGTGGDKTNGAVTAALISNAGTISIKGDTVATLTNITGDIIPMTDVLVAGAAGALGAGAQLSHPAFGPTAVAVPTTAGSGTTARTQRDAVWTYTYANTTLYAPGTYTTQVTYTATAP